MTEQRKRPIPFDVLDEMRDPRPAETDFARISRRRFLAGTAAVGAGAFVVSAGIRPAAASTSFTAVAASSEDTVIVPEGYSWYPVISWGDPMWSAGAPFDQATRGTGDSQELAFGDNCDGMELFTVDGATVLAVNNEYINTNIVYPHESALPESADDARKAMAAHGVSLVEIAEVEGKWAPVVDSPYNRKITADTPIEISGPARGHDLLKTAADADGALVHGTLNNCGAGRTPWQTFLTCEENFNGYFSSSDANLVVPAAFGRYGISVEDAGYGWAPYDDRFDIAKNPNEPNRFGYVVEIDPADPQSTPKKRTALGRFKHENAEAVLAADGRVVVYMGDDERGEFLYRFVSAGTYAEGGDTATLLDEGTLSVAVFGEDGTGQWVDLTPESTGMASLAEICIHTRQAASAVGATTMDRPEWVAANPMAPEAYCCLTNNTNRGVKPNAGGDETPVGGPNPRAENPYGQIVRWRPAGGDHAAADFTWDLYVMAGNPTVHQDEYAGSDNVTPDNMFNSPDGLRFDSAGALWIQTDGNYSNADGFAGMGNNQMLVGNAETGEINRFLVGPKECEVTGITWSADKKTMFIGIQHPGEDGNSHFPDGGDSAPRSTVVAVVRDDGGEIG